MNTKNYTPDEFFTELKSKKMQMTAEGLDEIYDNCLALLGEYHRTGQIAAQKKLIFHIDNIMKEKQLVDMGIDTFIYKSDIDDYIHQVNDRVVKIIELERYERRIPEEIIQAIEKSKGIFSQMYVLYTDYTGREERKVEKERRNRDPILFGTFQDRNIQAIVERFYVLGDWVDEYCDLTLDKMVAEMKQITGTDITKKISTPANLSELRNQLDNLSYDGMNWVQDNPTPAKKVGFFDKIRSFLKGERHG